MATFKIYGKPTLKRTLPPLVIPTSTQEVVFQGQAITFDGQRVVFTLGTNDRGVTND
jgi:hypothetical protein